MHTCLLRMYTHSGMCKRIRTLGRISKLERETVQ